MRALTLLNPHKRRSRLVSRRSGSRLTRSYGLRSNPFDSYTAYDFMLPAVKMNPSKRKKTTATKKRKSTKRKPMAKKSRKARKSTRRSPVRAGKRRRKSSIKVRARRAYRSAKKAARRATKRTRKFVKSEGKGIAGMFKSLASKDTLQTVGGIALGNVASKFVMSRFGASLPMSGTPLVNTLYQGLIPVIGAVVVRRFAPRVAEGMILGGALTIFNSLVSQFAPNLGFGSYVDASAPQPVLPYPVGRLAATTGSVDSATRINANIGQNTMAYSGIYDSPMPFQSDAWSN